MAERGIAFSDLPIHAFATAEAFEAWLADSHATVPAIAVRFGKKGSGIPSITYAEAVDVALCYGWIDGQAKSEGAQTYLQRFGKRKSKSLWSKINCGHVQRLIDTGRMRASGLAEVERARADGRWDVAYSSPSNATVPADLAAALSRNRRAKRAFDALDAQNRYAILHRLETAKRPETRARRIASFVEMLTRDPKLHG